MNPIKTIDAKYRCLTPSALYPAHTTHNHPLHKLCWAHHNGWFSLTNRDNSHIHSNTNKNKTFSLSAHPCESKQWRLAAADRTKHKAYSIHFLNKSTLSWAQLNYPMSPQWLVVALALSASSLFGCTVTLFYSLAQYVHCAVFLSLCLTSHCHCWTVHIATEQRFSLQENATRLGWQWGGVLKYNNWNTNPRTPQHRIK